MGLEIAAGRAADHRRLSVHRSQVAVQRVHRPLARRNGIGMPVVQAESPAGPIVEQYAGARRGQAGAKRVGQAVYPADGVALTVHDAEIGRIAAAVHRRQRTHFGPGPERMYLVAPQIGVFRRQQPVQRPVHKIRVAGQPIPIRIGNFLGLYQQMYGIRRVGRH